MNDKAEKVLVVESDDGLREHIVAVLRDAGYGVSTDSREGMKAVVAFDPGIAYAPAETTLETPVETSTQAPTDA